MKRRKKRSRYGRQFRPVVYSVRQMPIKPMNFPENPEVSAKQAETSAAKISTKGGQLSAKMEKRNFLREIWLMPVRFYRRCISPLFPGVCRFSPTCSAYCMEAVREWGILRGTALAAWRILRCNPFGGKGYDPVPKKNKKQ